MDEKLRKKLAELPGLLTDDQIALLTTSGGITKAYDLAVFRIDDFRSLFDSTPVPLTMLQVSRLRRLQRWLRSQIISLEQRDDPIDLTAYDEIAFARDEDDSPQRSLASATRHHPPGREHESPSKKIRSTPPSDPDQTAVEVGITAVEAMVLPAVAQAEPATSARPPPSAHPRTVSEDKAFQELQGMMEAKYECKDWQEEFIPTKALRALFQQLTNKNSDRNWNLSILKP